MTDQTNPAAQPVQPTVQAAPVAAQPEPAYVPQPVAPPAPVVADPASKLLTAGQAQEIADFAMAGDFKNAICALTHYLR